MPDSKRRGLLTEREREILHGDADVTDDYRYVVVSRVRQKIRRLEGDLEALEQHDSLADELRTIVCSNSTDD
jgi:hypothetical protein